MPPDQALPEVLIAAIGNSVYVNYGYLAEEGSELERYLVLILNTGGIAGNTSFMLFAEFATNTADGFDGWEDPTFSAAKVHYLICFKKADIYRWQRVDPGDGHAWDRHAIRETAWKYRVYPEEDNVPERAERWSQLFPNSVQAVANIAAANALGGGGANLVAAPFFNSYAHDFDTQFHSYLENKVGVVHQTLLET